MKERIHLSLNIICWLAVGIWVAGITCLSSIGGKELDPYMLPVPNWDKVCHLLAFAAGSGTLALALRRTAGLSWKGILVAATVAISLFGAVDEWHQLYTPGRSGADVGDWTADTVGAALGAGVLLFVYARFQTRPRTDRAAAPGD